MSELTHDPFDTREQPQASIPALSCDFCDGAHRLVLHLQDEIARLRGGGTPGPAREAAPRADPTEAQVDAAVEVFMQESGSDHSLRQRVRAALFAAAAARAPGRET